jgi:hypothetical protein
MQRLSLASLHAALPPPQLACAQCLLRLSALSALLQAPPRRQQPPLAALPPLFSALDTFRAALATAPPATWPLAASAFQQSALFFVVAQQPPPRTPAPPHLSSTLDALLTTAITLSLLCESGSASASGLQPALPLGTLLPAAISAVRAGCLEKWGCAPPIEVVAASPAAGSACHSFAPSAPALTVPALVAHSLTELLKNAAVATEQRYGVMGLDDAPPITVSATLITSRVPTLALTVTDSGVGLPAGRPASGAAGSFPHGHFPYFASTHATAHPFEQQQQQQEGADWRYSRSFGSALFGKGVGLARASLHARLHGGALQLAGAGAGEGGGGTTATLTLQCSGEHVFDPHEELQ